jgi:hypothetical protein
MDGQTECMNQTLGRHVAHVRDGATKALGGILHDVFHVSVLRHYISDPTHVIDLSSLQVSDEGALMAEPVRILDHRVRQLRRRTVDQVKVQWDSYSPHSTTWEDADDMRQQFPFLFDG